MTLLAESDRLMSITSVAGMLLFLAIFIGVFAWVATRSRREISRWSQLPLDDRGNADE